MLNDASYVQKHAVEGAPNEELLTLQAVLCGLTQVSRAEASELFALLAQRSRAHIWDFFLAGKYIPDPAPRGAQWLTPLMFAIKHKGGTDLSTDRDDEIFPEITHTVLMARSNPNQMSHGSSPLCTALRYGDVDEVDLLLRYRASPTLCEPGHDDPIFLAIQCRSLRCVRLLVQFRADLDVQQNFINEDGLEGTASGAHFRQRSILEAASDCIAILQMLRDTKGGHSSADR